MKWACRGSGWVNTGQAVLCGRCVAESSELVKPALWGALWSAASRDVCEGQGGHDVSLLLGNSGTS